MSGNKLKLNQSRTVAITVPVPLNGQMFEFDAVCKIVQHKKDDPKQATLDDVLISVDLEITKDDGQPMSAEEARDYVVADDMLSGLTLQAFNLGNLNTLEKSKTYLQQQQNATK